MDPKDLAFAIDTMKIGATECAKALTDSLLWGPDGENVTLAVERAATKVLQDLNRTQLLNVAASFMTQRAIEMFKVVWKEEFEKTHKQNEPTN